MHRTTYTEDEADFPLYATEAVQNKDPRASPDFSSAKQKELLGLLERGTFNVVLCEKMPKNAPVMKGRFVLAKKHRGTDQEIFKALYVAQGLLDPLEECAVHNSPNLRQGPLYIFFRLLLTLAGICGFEVWALDRSQVHLQAANVNTRDIFLQPPIELELLSDEFLKLMKTTVWVV
jgi:hypothetical protein